MNVARLLIVVALGVPAWCAVIYTNLGPGDSYSSSSYSVYAGQSVAAEFVPSGTGMLDNLRLALIRTGLNDPTADLLISVRVPGPDPNGAAIESWVLTPAEVSPPVLPPGNIEVLLSSFHPILTAGSAYWLRVESATPFPFQAYAWAQNVTGGTGGTVVSLNQGLTWALAGDNPAFEVNAVVSSAIPEPASALLIGIGLLAMIACRRPPSART